MAVNRTWFYTKLASAAVLLSGALFMFALSSGIAPCNKLFAQSTSCSVGDTEVFTGSTQFQGDIEVGATPTAGDAFDILQSQGASTPPEWAIAGVVKPADETVNDSATFQDDDDLFWTVEANAIYQVAGVMTFSSGTTPDFKFQFTVPAGTIIDGIVTNGPDGALTNELKTFAEAASTTLDGDGSDIATMVMFTVVTSATSGTVQLQWAQNTQNASNTVLRKGSGWTIMRLD